MLRNIQPLETTEVSVLEKTRFLIDLQINQLKNGEKLYPNQYNTAETIVKTFLENPKILTQMVIALCQSGKAGVKLAIIQKALEYQLVDIDNIYIITGLSSLEWKRQMKNRFPPTKEQKIFHGSEITKSFLKTIKDKHNILILIDEIHSASKQHQRVYKCFKEAGFYDKDFLFNNDVKIVEFDATPDGTLYDLSKWKEHQKLIKLEPGQNYTSCFELLEQNRVRQFKDLECFNRSKDKIEYDLFKKNVKDLIHDIQAYEEPLYHIIRTPNGERQYRVISNLKTVFPECEYNYIHFNEQSDLENIDILLKQPDKHTFILIKEKLRCSITYPLKKHLGISYERHTYNPNDSVIIQGLLGRLCGYTTCPQNICYTNIYSIIKYKLLYDSDFQDTSINWNSLTTRTVKDVLTGKDTFNSTKYVRLDQDIKEKDINIGIKIFNTEAEFLRYHHKYKNSSLSKLKPDTDGYYYTILNNNRIIASLDYVKKNSHNGIGISHDFKRYACYEDVNDKSTLKFVGIYKTSLSPS